MKTMVQFLKAFGLFREVWIWALAGFVALAGFGLQADEVLRGLSGFRLQPVGEGDVVRFEYDLQGGAQDRFLVWIAVSLDGGLTFEEEGWNLSGDGTSVPVSAGTGYQVVWSAREDLGFRDFGATQIRLLAGRVNESPVLEEIPSQKIPPLQLFEYSLAGSDANFGEQGLVYGLQRGPEGMRVDPNTGLLTWTPSVDQIGTHAVEVFVSDGLEWAVQSFTLEAGWVDFYVDLNGALSGGESIPMIWVEPGAYQRGSPLDEPLRDNDEGQHEVTLSQGFWLGQYEVTQRQWEALMGEQPSAFTDVGPQAPVDSVSWNDAVVFCQKLNDMEWAAGRLQEGYEYALPTEAQWEYACRAGTTTTYAFGNVVSSFQANFNGNDDGGADSGPNLQRSAPVGSYAPNVWGFYDMHGNIWEWCQDWYGAYPSEPVTDPVNWIRHTNRILRGGAWATRFKNIRSADREGGTEEFSDARIGFRLALRPVGADILYNDLDGALSFNEAIRMIRVPSGTFQMGSPLGEAERDNDELPHEVTLTQDYWLGQFEVTQRQWEVVMGSNPSEFDEVGPQVPVDSVSWNDAFAFCQRLNSIERAAGRLPEGYEYALPTEAQWEYACRAGTTSAFAYGDSLSSNQANFDGDFPYGAAETGLDLQRTAPVGSYAPNAWGFHDMHGNIWEWCQDWYGTYSPVRVTDPFELRIAANKILRGGSWFSRPKHLRSADREGASPLSRDARFGLRLAIRPSLDETQDLRLLDFNGLLSFEESVRMIWVSPGTFMMGSPTDESGRDSDERQHEVTLAQGYWLGETEVTQRQWEVLMGSNPSYYDFAGPQAPVESVSWNDVQDFCEALNEQERQAGRLPEGYEYALPTEAQWEYACRAGTTTPFAFGASLSSFQANFSGSHWRTKEVRSYSPNAWGFYDMHGNVSEWCEDWYVSDYPAEPVANPVGPASGDYRVVRGGSYYFLAEDCRSAYRNAGEPSYDYWHFGFRLSLRSK